MPWALELSRNGGNDLSECLLESFMSNINQVHSLLKSPNPSRSATSIIPQLLSRSRQLLRSSKFEFIGDVGSFSNKESRYCVRPNSGRIEPGKEVEVTGMCYNNMALIWY